MNRREQYAIYRCPDPGCREYAQYRYRNRAAAKRLHAQYGNDKWRCLRHSNSGRVLGPGRLKLANELETNKIQGCGDELFWTVPGGATNKSGSGFIHGPGFIGWANDFPEGTRLVVTARIVMPAHEESST